MAYGEKFIPFRQSATELLLYRQYNTYQILLEAYPINDLSVDGCFSKIILYMMDWFKNRIGDDNLSKLSEIAFLNTDYPKPEDYASFDITKVDDINSLSVVDVKTSYMDNRKGWVFQLVEPDNGNERKDIHGRVFTTNICVYKKDESVVFGVRTSCREPITNTEDADVYRPAFVKKIFSDEDLELCEAGVDRKYRFGMSPIIVNGKSNQECKDIYEGLIANPNRQLPILFLPGDDCLDGDEKLVKRVNGTTRSYLGFCHVVAWKNNNRKLFGQAMNDEELIEVSSEGQFVVYRSNPGRGYEAEPSYFEDEDEEEIEMAVVAPEDGTEAEVADELATAEENQDVEELPTLGEELPVPAEEEAPREIRKEKRFDRIDPVIKKADPLRRQYDFGEYSLTADRWDPERVLLSLEEGIDDSEEKKLLKAELDRIKSELEDVKRDSESIQLRNNEYKETNRDLEKQRDRAYAEVNKMRKSLDEEQKRANEAVKSNKELSSRNYTLERSVAGYMSAAREEYAPLINLPAFETGTMDEIKENILAWIEVYYGDSIIIHDRAKKGFMKDNRNLDWRTFCLMIHYVAGYTIRCNDGVTGPDDNPSRDHDPESYAFKCEPASSGSSGATVMYKDKYTINVKEFDPEEDNVVLNFHITQGKGRGDDMIRIYFWYDGRIKKSIIGHMPDHLPTRKDAH